MTWHQDDDVECAIDGRDIRQGFGYLFVILRDAKLVDPDGLLPCELG